MRVWTLLISNEYGTCVSVYHQLKNAKAELLEYVETHWVEEDHGDFDKLTPDEAIHLYFDGSYDEWYELASDIVMDEPEE